MASPVPTSRRLLDIVVAATRTNGIGKDGQLPWRLPQEMKHFKAITSAAPTGLRNAVIMGRHTWGSIPKKFRPLANRPDVLVATSLEAALQALQSVESLHKVFVIGGARLINETMTSKNCGTLHLTRIDAEPECDVFMKPVDPAVFKLVEESETHSENSLTYKFLTYKTAAALTAAPNNENSFAVANGASSAVSSTASPLGPKSTVENGGKKEEEGTASGAATGTATSAAAAPMRGIGADGRHEEMQYLDLIRDIIDHGVQRGDRTGTGTLSKFGVTMRFSLRGDVLPVLTTKRVFWRGVAEELLWFVSGSTDARELQAKKIRIWDGNSSREFLDSRGFTDREVGDLGPVYGFQWRHFGAKYVDFNTDYTGQGVDQLARCINTIKTNPNCRRIVMSAWNPADLDQMALPPCHMFCQFYVANGELSCQMYQRSADMGLGVPFNVASYALLTRMVAQVCGLKAGDFIHVIGDAHVYLNHVEPLRKQLTRTPRSFPLLHIDPSVTDIDGFEYSHFTLEGYKPHKSIKMKMAV